MTSIANQIMQINEDIVVQSYKKPWCRKVFNPAFQFLVPDELVQKLADVD